MKRITRISVIALTVLPLIACATPKARLRTGLADAGLPDRTATCMADYMAPRLSLPQLRRLQSLASVSKVDYRRITVDQYLHKVRALKDTELWAVTGKAALNCTL
ncbi:MAG: hypothetical protein AB7D33_14410 [Sphingobium sp.]